MKWLLPNDHVVEYNPNGIHIYLVIIKLISQHFWRHVARRPASLELILCLFIVEICQTEIAYGDIIGIFKQNVIRFQISVYDLLIVHVLHSLADLQDQECPLFFFSNSDRTEGIYIRDQIHYINSKIRNT